MKTIIQAQAGLFQVKLPRSTPLQKIGDKRRVIQKFSKASRKRLLDMFASMNITRRHQAVFLSLTYGNDYPDEMQAKEHLWAFIQRLKRLNPRISGVWRMEHQTRNAPHFHLILLNWRFIPADKLSEMWSQVIGIEYAANYEATENDGRVNARTGEPLSGMVNDFAMVNVETIKGKRAVQNYVAKYVAKHDHEAEMVRRDNGFNDVAYLDAQNRPGRFWGVINKHLLPFAVVTAIRVNVLPETFARWVFSASMKYGNVGKSSDGSFEFKEQGFTLYVENAHKWLRYFLQVHIESWEFSKAG